jgi:hypothetical protein
MLCEVTFPMMQVVRRQPSVFTATKVVPFVTRKARMLEFAFVSLAATNLFIVSSAVAFYWFAHKS